MNLVFNATLPQSAEGSELELLALWRIPVASTEFSYADSVNPELLRSIYSNAPSRFAP